ncbi:MAG: hypothetical protein R3F20_08780 [Planctomycetota bacterium]
MTDRRFLLLLALALVGAGLVAPLLPIVPAAGGDSLRPRPVFSTVAGEGGALADLEAERAAERARLDALGRSLAPEVPLARWEEIALRRVPAANAAEILAGDARLHLAVGADGIAASRLWRDQARSPVGEGKTPDRRLRVAVGEGASPADLLALLAGPPVGVTRVVEVPSREESR